MKADNLEDIVVNEQQTAFISDKIYASVIFAEFALSDIHSFSFPSILCLMYFMYQYIEEITKMTVCHSLAKNMLYRLV